MTTQIIPLNGNILIEKQPKETKTASGMIIPEGVADAPDIATVIAVTAERAEKQTITTNSDKSITVKRVVIKSNLNVGDKVLYKEWGMTPIKLDGKEYFLVKETDLLAIIKESV